MSDVLQHFSKDLKDEALRQLAEHLRLSDQADLDPASFARLATLVFAVLRRLQDRLFDAGPLSPLDFRFAHGKKDGLQQDLSGRQDWTIRATPSSGGKSARPHHHPAPPTLAQLLSKAGLADAEVRACACVCLIVQLFGASYRLRTPLMMGLICFLPLVGGGHKPRRRRALATLWGRKFLWRGLLCEPGVGHPWQGGQRQRPGLFHAPAR